MWHSEGVNQGARSYTCNDGKRRLQRVPAPESRLPYLLCTCATRPRATRPPEVGRRLADALLLRARSGAFSCVLRQSRRRGRSTGGVFFCTSRVYGA